MAALGNRIHPDTPQTEFGDLLRSTVEESDGGFFDASPLPPLVKVGGVNWIFQMSLLQKYRSGLFARVGELKEGQAAISGMMWLPSRTS